MNKFLFDTAFFLLLSIIFLISILISKNKYPVWEVLLSMMSISLLGLILYTGSPIKGFYTQFFMGSNAMLRIAEIRWYLSKKHTK